MTKTLPFADVESLSPSTHQFSFVRKHDDRRSVPLLRCDHRRLGDGSVHALVPPVQLSFDEPVPRGEVERRHRVFGEVFGAGNDLVHRLDHLHRVFAFRRFSREHDAVGAIVDGIGDVSDFGTSGSGILNEESNVGVQLSKGNQNTRQMKRTHLSHGFKHLDIVSRRFN